MHNEGQQNSVRTFDVDRLMELIRTRRSIREFEDRRVPREMVATLIEAATWAPNHRHTEPWRFKVIEKDGETRKEVADLVYEWTWENVKNPNPTRREQSSAAAREEVLGTPLLMMVYSVPGPNEEVTQENYAATCCGMQNLMLVAHALGLSVGWSTGRLCKSDKIHTAVGAEDDWQIVGAFYIGFPKIEQSAERMGVDEVATYMP